jgi:alkylation response protein AidB-like acyl-CoA dehydrogenase
MTVVPAILGVSDRFDDALCAVADGSLSAEKRFVDYAECVSHHLVAASEGGKPGLFLISVDDTVSFAKLRTIGGTPQSHVAYHGTLAQRVAGADGYRFLLQICRTLAAVQCLGAAQRAFEMTVEYVGVRTQFGRPIGSFQAVQHHIANMATMVTACRFLVYEALWKLDVGAVLSTEIETAKAWASKTATEVPMMAHQLHGGIGVTLEYDLQLLSRRGKDRAVSWGSTEECLAAIGDALASVGAA